jgi:hypothetical protein
MEAGRTEMREVFIRQRRDGVTELSPKLAPLDREDRWLIIMTFMLSAGCLFLAGVMPVSMVGALFASCIAGELVLGVKALALILLRPPAEVFDIPTPFRRRAR